MMKFILVVVLGCLVGWLSEAGFWMVGGVMSLALLFFTSEGLGVSELFFMGSSLSMDFMSFSLVGLSLWLCVLMLFSSGGVYFSGEVKSFSFFVVALALVLLCAFLVNNFFSFYFFFESSLVPTLFIIMGWGYQPERLQAGVYFLFYTLVASLPLLLLISGFYFDSGGSTMWFCWGLQSVVEFTLFFFMVLAFLVKMPMYFFHLWLPSAHVEAPVSGSMVLAGVLLKLGGYGLWRVWGLVAPGAGGFGGYFFGLSVLGMVYVGVSCLRLGDMKALVAYSSVAHMGLVICGLMSLYHWGVSGALVMMIGHGVCSSGLFCAVNIYYERSGSRAFYINRGVMGVLPVFALMFFLLCAANMAAPPTMCLLSEVFLMGGMIKYDYLMLLFFPLGSYLGAVFTLFLFSYSQHGKCYSGVYSFSFMSELEIHLMMMHLVPLNLIFLKFEFFLSSF